MAFSIICHQIGGRGRLHHLGLFTVIPIFHPPLHKYKVQTKEGHKTVFDVPLISLLSSSNKNNKEILVVKKVSRLIFVFKTYNVMQSLPFNILVIGYKVIRYPNIQLASLKIKGLL